MTIIIFQKLVFDACWWRSITLKQQTCWLIWQRVKVRFCRNPLKRWKVPFVVDDRFCRQKDYWSRIFARSWAHLCDVWHSSHGIGHTSDKVSTSFRLTSVECTTNIRGLSLLQIWKAFKDSTSDRYRRSII